MRPMAYEFAPEPSPEEREALERALEGLDDGEQDPRGAWWRAGLRESLAEGGLDETVAVPSGRAARPDSEHRSDKPS
jgi:hypothetical protein